MHESSDQKLQLKYSKPTLIQTQNKTIVGLNI